MINFEFEFMFYVITVSAHVMGEHATMCALQDLTTIPRRVEELKNRGTIPLLSICFAFHRKT